MRRSRRQRPGAYSPRPAHADAAPARVLVVDDNQDAADMLAFLFGSHGFEACAVYDGEKALQETARFGPNVVVMDLGMPGLNGYETARRIRDRPRGKEMLLIALTGWGQEGTRKKALEAGFDFHVIKPVDIDILKGYIVQS